MQTMCDTFFLRQTSAICEMREYALFDDGLPSMYVYMCVYVSLFCTTHTSSIVEAAAATKNWAYCLPSAENVCCADLFTILFDAAAVIRKTVSRSLSLHRLHTRSLSISMLSLSKIDNPPPLHTCHQQIYIYIYSFIERQRSINCHPKRHRWR